MCVRAYVRVLRWPVYVRVMCAHRETLTEEDDDAEEDGDDGARAQAGGDDVLLVGAVAVQVALAHLDPQVGRVGHGQVARVRDDDGDLVDAALQEANLQTHLGVVA